MQDTAASDVKQCLDNAALSLQECPGAGGNTYTDEQALKACDDSMVDALQRLRGFCPALWALNLQGV